MKKEVNLEDIKDSLKHTHVVLNMNFLNKLLQCASNSRDPHKNKKFCKLLDTPINQSKKSSLTVYGWIKGYRTIPFSKLIKIVELSDYSWKDVENNLISIKSGIRKGEINPKFPIRIDKGMGSIVGHIMGDGSIDKRFHSVFYSNSNLDLLKEFSFNMKKIFGINPRIWVQKKRSFEEKSVWKMKVNSFSNVPEGHNVGLFYPKICCDILYSFFGRFAEGKNKKITKEILNSNSNVKKGFLRAFFDDEGSIVSKNHTMRIHQDDKIMLESIRKILKEFGIDSNIVRFYNKRNKLRCYFNITGFRNYYNFFNKIGCTSKKKEKEFKLLINKVQNSKRFKKRYAL